MNPAFAQKLGLYIQKTNVGAQKIESFALEIFGIVIADLEIEDKTSKSRFFQETFLVADIKFEAVLGMLFLKISNADVSFNKRTLTWKFYITIEALSTTKQVQIVNPKEFVIETLDVGSEIFIMHVAIWEQEKIPVHSKRQAQVRTLIFNEAPTEVLVEYSNYSNVFSAENVAELLEHIRMNEHAIKLGKDK